VSVWRYQAPVRSPLSVAALFAGARAAVARSSLSTRAEDRVVRLLHARYAPTSVLLTDSGTTALTGALLGLAGTARDRSRAPVAMPAYGCYDLATAAEGAGVRVLLYDLDPRTLAPDLDQVRAALREGAGAIVVAHLYGYPVDLSDVNRLAKEAGVVVIEDAAQAAGATLAKVPAGAQASLAVLSFGRGKGLTGGGGGALLGFDDVAAGVLERVRASLREPRRGLPQLLTLAAQWLFEDPNLYAVPAALPFLRLGETIYRAPRAGRAPNATSCSVVAETWALAGREVEVRRRNAERLLVALRRQPELQPVVPSPSARPGYLRLPVLASPRAMRSVAGTAARRLGVMRGYPRPLCDLERFAQRCLNRDAGFPGSRLLAGQLCTLPTHGGLGDRDLGRLEEWIQTRGER